MQIVFATTNKGKLKEFEDLMKDMDIEVLSLEDINFKKEISEEGETYSENALKKAKVVSTVSNKITLADDSGIEIAAYNNRPGVKSARFFPELSYEQKNRKIISDLEGTEGTKRLVKYKCCIAIYKPDHNFFTCMGECEGIISKEPKGKNGFGYDPIFFLPELGKTFAELPAELKNQISHRGKAFRQAKQILKKII
tara:strand:+ start:19974 stop:20561 length:588 start_codon:yes stop_codon:yes gene_type:complete